MKKSILSIISLFILITIGHSQIVHHKAYELLANSRGTGIDESPSTGGYVHSAIFNPTAVCGGLPNPMLLERSAVVLSDLDLNLLFIAEFAGMTETSSAHFDIKLYDVQEIPTGGFVAVGSLTDHSAGFGVPKGLVIRLDAGMGIVWAYTYLVHGEFKTVSNAGADDEGFIVGGYSTPSMTSIFKTGRLMRISAMGFPLWSSHPIFPAGSGGESIYNDIVQDNENPHKYYAVGSCMQGYGASGSLITSEVLVTAVDETVSISMPPHASKWIGRTSPTGSVIAEEGEAIDVDFQGMLVVAGRTYYENITTVPFVIESDALVISLDKFSLGINWANEYSMLSPNNLTFEKATTVDIHATSEINVGGVKDDESFIIKLDAGGGLIDHRLSDHGTKNQLNDMAKNPDGYTTTGNIYNAGAGSIENVYSYEQEFSVNDSCSFPIDPFVRNVILDCVNINTEYIYDIPLENPQLQVCGMNYDQYVICESDTLTPVDLPCTWETIAYSSFEPGWHVWNDGGAHARRSIFDAPWAEAGDYCIRLRGKTAAAKMTSDVFDLTNYEEIKIRFSYITRFHTNSWDDLYLEMSDDGGTTFTILKKWRYLVEYANDIRETANWNIAGPFTSTTVFRIRSHASNNWDKVYIDNVRIRGCRTAGTRLAQDNPQLLDANLGMTKGEIDDEGLTKKLDIEESDASLLVSNVYPNPSRDKINLAYATKENTDINITIVDVAGKIVFNRQINNTQGNQMEIIDVTKFHSGYYMIIIESEENREVQKFVKL
jgi:hypothetical protein